jgi:hypothetical protein
MPQGDLNVANQSGAAFRSDLNNQLLALGTMQSGTAAPDPSYAYQLWADTAAGLLKQRNGANNAWLTIGTLDATNWGLATAVSLTDYAPSKTGTGASGTWGINITGSSAQLNGISSTGLFNNMGQGHGTRVLGFDATTPSYDFGFRFVQNTANGPGTGGSQFYSLYTGLGSEYPATGAGSYGMYLAIDRNTANPYLSVRYNENNSLSTWRKINAGFADAAGNANTVASLAPASSGAAPSANQLVRTDGNGYTFTGYINSNTNNNENPGISQVIVTNGGDNYYRKAEAGYFARTIMNAPGTAPVYACRAWVNVSQGSLGSFAINGNGNVSSVTRQGLGAYAVNFTTAMPDTNYSAAFMAKRLSTNEPVYMYQRVLNTGSLEVSMGLGSFTLLDFDRFHLIVVR